MATQTYLDIVAAISPHPEAMTNRHENEPRRHHPWQNTNITQHTPDFAGTCPKFGCRLRELMRSPPWHELMSSAEACLGGSSLRRRPAPG